MRQCRVCGYTVSERSWNNVGLSRPVCPGCNNQWWGKMTMSDCALPEENPRRVHLVNAAPQEHDATKPGVMTGTRPAAAALIDSLRDAGRDERLATGQLYLDAADALESLRALATGTPKVDVFCAECSRAIKGARDIGEIRSEYPMTEAQKTDYWFGMYLEEVIKRRKLEAIGLIVPTDADRLETICVRAFALMQMANSPGAKFGPFPAEEALDLAWAVAKLRGNERQLHEAKHNPPREP